MHRLPLRFLLSAVAVLLLLPGSITAQDGRGVVAGRVVDLLSETVVVGATVTLRGTDRAATTDDSGFFEFVGLTPGDYEIEVRSPGYEPHTDAISVDADERLELRFSLGVDAIPLEPITVVARSRADDVERTLGRRFDGMSRAEIEQILPRTHSMADLIMATNTPGVSAIPMGNWVCLEHNRINRNRRDSNGREFCRPMAVYVDGVRSLVPTEILTELRPSEIERFEILGPLAATTLYGNEGAEGVLVIETVRGGRTFGDPAVRYSYDHSNLNVSFAVMGANPASLHDGLVLIEFVGGSTTSLYKERSGWRPGARAAFGYRFAGLRELRLSVYGTAGSSTGSYTSIRRFGQVLVQERGLASMGADLGVRLRVRGSEAWDLRFEVGPTLAWQRLRLSEGHQDEWASPTSLEDRDIQWRDRSWWSPGVIFGLDWSLILDDHWSAFTGVRIRALYYGDSRSWDVQDAQDIQRQTGNIVYVDYNQPVAFHPGIDVGLTWRR